MCSSKEYFKKIFKFLVDVCSRQHVALVRIRYLTGKKGKLQENVLHFMYFV